MNWNINNHNLKSLFSKKHIIYSLCILSLLLLQASFAFSNNTDLLKEANLAYTEGNYQIAKDKYEQILDSGKQSAALYYNLGNTYFQLKDNGKAMLNYERAKRLKPNDKDIANNILLIHKNLSKKVNTYPVIFYKQWWQNILNIFSSFIWSILCILALWGCFALGILFLKSNNDIKKRKRSFGSALALFVLSLLFFVFAFNKYQLETDSTYAVLTKENTSFKKDAAGNAEVLDELPAGIKVHIEDKIEDWVKILLTDDRTGWVKKENLEVI